MIDKNLFFNFENVKVCCSSFFLLLLFYNGSNGRVKLSAVQNSNSRGRHYVKLRRGQKKKIDRCDCAKKAVGMGWKVLYLAARPLSKPDKLLKKKQRQNY